MSKIMKTLCEAAEIDKKRGEDEQDFRLRLAVAVNKLPDAEWNKIDPKAQDWVNSASDATNAKKDIPDFPDDEKAETTTRRRAAAAEPEPYTPKLKDKVAIVTKRGKNVVGVIVEMDKEVIVVKTDEGEEELNRERIANIGPADGAGSDKAADDEGPKDPVKGDTVTVTTKRGKVVTGELVEIDDEVIVLKVDGTEEEFAKDRVESIKVEGGSKASKEETTTRRRSTGAAEPDKKEEPAARTRSTNEKGVSVGTRVRELIVENMDAKMEDIGKSLKKEGIEFRENTLQLNYADAHKMLDLLKKAKLLK